jgi:uncharacterized protein (TIGR02246 family)
MTAPDATHPNDLSRLLVQFANSGDAAAVAGLYAEDAVMAVAGRPDAVSRDAIRVIFEKALAQRPQFTLGEQRPALIWGDLALTSTRLPDGTVTAEVARRQPDGTWLWVLDNPAIASGDTQ